MVKIQILLRAKTDRKLWRAMIAHILQAHSSQKKIIYSFYVDRFASFNFRLQKNYFLIVTLYLFAFLLFLVTQNTSPFDYFIAIKIFNLLSHLIMSTLFEFIPVFHWSVFLILHTLSFPFVDLVFCSVHFVSFHSVFP